MAWPWKFMDLSPDERHARRLVLDRYGHYGALFSASPVLIMLLVRIVQWAVALNRTLLIRRGFPSRVGNFPMSGSVYNVIPDSPSLKLRRLTARGSWEKWLRRAKWWLSDDVVVFGQRLGQRDLWVGGALWMAVLLLLCVVETGRDYMHVTKRFGIVGMSQLPLQYILALRHVSPVLFVFGTSHEQVNRWHRVLGAVVYILLILHSVFYLNYFAYTGNFWRLMLRPVIALGLTAFTSMTILTTTALAFVRRWSYRVFFIIHVIVAFTLPFIVLFHASHAGNYVAAALLLLLADLTLRKIFTVTTKARIEKISGTELLRLTAPIPSSKFGKFRQHPGSHVYLSLPGTARPSSKPLSPSYILYELLFNPFTIASVKDRADELTLVIRARNGPMSTTLSQHSSTPIQLSKSVDSEEDDPNGDNDDESTPAFTTVSQRGLHPATNSGPGTIPVNIEGPYGSAAYFPELTPRNFDRVLLVAGGVGATFAVPLYWSILDNAAASTNSGSPKVGLVWSVRGAGDLTWAAVSGQDGSSRSLLQDPNVQIFLTGEPNSGASDRSATDNAIELTAFGDPHISSASPSPLHRAISDCPIKHQRPDLQQIVDNVFRHGSEERVAVLVCGPEAMVQGLRSAVATWVHRGRTVWWHDESFGW
ncbi:hypothetical protein SEPCBS57363_005356 [Sporothrix epigloea]|uniref:FAD-binding FR-type domain-containing protein n=1 Tax=Sporothrix epigloea TaxID=1892477 RepID=A0ABP0DXA2_9PEZI